MSLSAPSPALTAVELTKRYGKVLALDRASVEIAAGSRVALVGPNGAGKSTLLKCWMGFERPSGGRIGVLGLDPSRERDRIVRRLGYLHQGSNLYQDLTVLEHLALATSLRDGFERASAEHRLHQVDVPLDRPTRTLSGGQQAQVGIAIALAAGGEVILLDEPLGSLDPLARDDFARFLVGLVDVRDRTFVISSHDIAGLETMCDHLVVLNRGRVLLAGNIDSILESHVAVDGDLPGPAPSVVGSVVGRGGSRVMVASRSDAGMTIGARRPSLDEVVVAYLSARPGESA